MSLHQNNTYLTNPLVQISYLHRMVLSLKISSLLSVSSVFCCALSSNVHSRLPELLIVYRAAYKPVPSSVLPARPVSSFNPRELKNSQPINHQFNHLSNHAEHKTQHKQFSFQFYTQRRRISIIINSWNHVAVFNCSLVSGLRSR